MADTEPTEPADAHTGRRLVRAIPTVLLYVAAAVAAWFLWPTSLGGCTTLTLVNGHSMEPTYYTGDLVVARCGAPKVGDIVVYEPPGYGSARVVHRIIGGDENGWTIQGDNNDFVDPFTPTNDNIVGIARVHIAKVGIVASTLTNPWIWVSLIVLAIGILMWPGKEEPEDDDESEKSDEQESDTAAAAVSDGGLDPPDQHSAGPPGDAGEAPTDDSAPGTPHEAAPAG